MRSRSITLTRGGKSYNPYNFVGTWPNAVELNQHVVAHGRMFNELDDDAASAVCVIGTATRDELFGAPEDVGREINPVGETININGQPFVIIGMFQHYESELEHKRREMEKSKPKEVQTGPTRSRGGGGRIVGAQE